MNPIFWKCQHIETGLYFKTIYWRSSGLGETKYRKQVIPVLGFYITVFSLVAGVSVWVYAVVMMMRDTSGLNVILP